VQIVGKNSVESRLWERKGTCIELSYDVTNENHLSFGVKWKTTFIIFGLLSSFLCRSTSVRMSHPMIWFVRMFHSFDVVHSVKGARGYRCKKILR